MAQPKLKQKEQTEPGWRPTRDEAIDAATVGVLTAVALVAFRSSYGGVAFLLTGIAATVIGLGVAWLWVKREWPWPTGVVAAVVVYAVVVGTIALPSRAIAGFLPSPQSMTAALLTAITGWKELLTTQPPVGRTGDLMVIPAVTGMASGFAGYLLAQRLQRVPLAAIPPFIALGLAIATGVDEPVSVLLNGAVMAGVTIAWLAYRENRVRPLLQVKSRSRRRMAGGLAVLALAASGGFALSGSLPGADANDRAIWRGLVPPFDPQEYPSPLAGYRSYVKAADCRDDSDACNSLAPGDRDPVMFEVEGLPVDVPVRLATMDYFDGFVWQTWNGGPDAEPSINRSGAFERIGVAVDPEFPGEIVDVVITIREYSDVWIPGVGEIIRLEFTGSDGGPERDRQLAAAFRYNRDTDTAASPLRLQPGDRYEMKVRLPVVLESYGGELLVPNRNVPQGRNVDEVSNRLSSAELLLIADDGERLDYVRQQMIRFGTYSDGDVAAAQIRANPGHSEWRMTQFVQDYPRRPLIGNAEQYASAFALTFRQLQLPTRVVMGFMPSDNSLDRPVAVRATEVEAWVELPFQDHGWVGIFPTPPRDQTAIQTAQPQQPEPDYRTQNPPPPPLIDPEFDQAATRSGQAEATEDEERQTEEPVRPPGPGLGEQVSNFIGRPAVIAGAAASSPFLVAGLSALAIVTLKRRRRKRRMRKGRPHERIANGWRELTDYATDMGRVVPATTTRREASSLVGAGTRPLADRADAAVWGPGEPPDEVVDAYWADLADALNGMKSELGLVDRMKTAVSLQSLRRREKQDRLLTRDRKRKSANDE